MDLACGRSSKKIIQFQGNHASLDSSSKRLVHYIRILESLKHACFVQRLRSQGVVRNRVLGVVELIVRIFSGT